MLIYINILFENTQKRNTKSYKEYNYCQFHLSEHTTAIIEDGSSVTIVCKKDESIQILDANTFKTNFTGSFRHMFSMDGIKCSVDRDHVIQNAKAMCDKKTSCTLFGDDEMFQNQCKESEVTLKVMYLCVKKE